MRFVSIDWINMKQTTIVTRLEVFPVNENTSLTTLQPFDVLMSHKTGFLAEVETRSGTGFRSIFSNDRYYRRTWVLPAALTLGQAVETINRNTGEGLGNLPLPDYVIRPSIKPS